jgi:hypothetical protein
VSHGIRFLAGSALNSVSEWIGCLRVLGWLFVLCRTQLANRRLSSAAIWIARFGASPVSEYELAIGSVGGHSDYGVPAGMERAPATVVPLHAELQPLHRQGNQSVRTVPW